MFINDIHIIYYILFILLGAVVGQFTDWIINRSLKEEKIFLKDIITKYKENFKPNYILVGVTIVIYLIILSMQGISGTFYGNLKLILYLIITPILISMCIIDYKEQIIPNRLNLTLFEIGLVYTLLIGFINVHAAIYQAIGMLIGGGIFLIITLIGGLIAGKEAMGFGDVKLMCAIGITFGMQSTINISILSFLIGAIISIILLACKIKKTNEYIPFGPFIVISTFITMIVPANVITIMLLKVFTLGMF